MSIASRISDRVRPWSAAGRGRPDGPTVAVIGAGPAGLATAALLQRDGARVTIFDRAESVGSSWAGRYDSLRLNTVRWMSDLPGLRLPRRMGRWVGRDDLVSYLDQYAMHHGLSCRLGDDGDVVGLRPTDAGWRVDGAGWVVDVDAAVVATGGSGRPVTPDWPGADAWPAPRLTHAAAYERPDPFVGHRVVVAGAGSSGGELCVELANAGIDVTWAVRATPAVLPREAWGLPTTPFGPPIDAVPDRYADRAVPWFERRLYGERDYLPPPPESVTVMAARCKGPLTADGIVEVVRSGQVRVVGPVDRLDNDGVVLADGSRVGCDRVIAATGYTPALDRLVGSLQVLGANGRPTALIPRPRLGFVGYRVGLTGTLWAIEQDARTVASRLLR